MLHCPKQSANTDSTKTSTIAHEQGKTTSFDRWLACCADVPNSPNTAGKHWFCRTVLWLIPANILAIRPLPLPSHDQQPHWRGKKHARTGQLNHRSPFPQDQHAVGLELTAETMLSCHSYTSFTCPKWIYVLAYVKPSATAFIPHGCRVITEACKGVYVTR